jgi:hypothetical protein
MVGRDHVNASTDQSWVSSSAILLVLDVGHYGVPDTEDYNHLDDILDKHHTLEELQAALGHPPLS